MVSAQWILAALAVIFTILVGARLARNGGRWDAASRTWTLIAVIFFIVAVVFSR